MKRSWFKSLGHVYYPISWQGFIITAFIFIFCAHIFLFVDVHSHSVSDTLYGIFPYWIPALLLYLWIAMKMSARVLKKGVDFVGVTVISFCHDGHGNVFLNKRSVNCRDEHGRWDLCGGGVDFGDAILATMRKEICEEYSTDVLSSEFLGYRDIFREQNGVKTHWVQLNFKVLIDRAKAKNGEPHKFDDMQWFPIGKFPTPMHSQFAGYWEEYKDRLL